MVIHCRVGGLENEPIEPRTDELIHCRVGSRGAHGERRHSRDEGLRKGLP